MKRRRADKTTKHKTGEVDAPADLTQNDYFYILRSIFIPRGIYQTPRYYATILIFQKQSEVKRLSGRFVSDSPHSYSWNTGTRKQFKSVNME